MTPPLLQMRNIETFYGPIMAIRGVSLRVDEGEIVAVLGANGAGKTTLLKTATGALDSNKGQVLLDGEEIQCRDPDWVARKGIAHVPEGREVFPLLSVRENLEMGADCRRDREQVAADIDTVYEYFPALKSLDGSMAAFLSGGQQQMLAIGRGFMSRPKLLLLDEPSLGLSPVLVGEIFAQYARPAARSYHDAAPIGGRDGAAQHAAGEHQRVRVRAQGNDVEIDPLQPRRGSLKVPVVESQHHGAPGARIEDAREPILHAPVEVVRPLEEETLAACANFGLKALGCGTVGFGHVSSFDSPGGEERFYQVGAVNRDHTRLPITRPTPSRASASLRSPSM